MFQTLFTVETRFRSRIWYSTVKVYIGVQEMRGWCGLDKYSWKGYGDDKMRGIHALLVVTVLVIGFAANVGSFTGSYNSFEVIPDQYLDQVRHFTLQDGIPAVEEYSGYTETPIHRPLDIQVSDDSKFHYMACSPYYKVYFRGARARMIVQDAWIECELINQELGELGAIEQAAHVMSRNTLSVSDVFTSVDLSYEVGTSLLRETLILEEPKNF